MGGLEEGGVFSYRYCRLFVEGSCPLSLVLKVDLLVG